MIHAWFLLCALSATQAQTDPGGSPHTDPSEPPHTDPGESPPDWNPLEALAQARAARLQREEVEAATAEALSVAAQKRKEWDGAEAIALKLQSQLEMARKIEAAAMEAHKMGGGSAEDVALPLEDECGPLASAGGCEMATEDMLKDCRDACVARGVMPALMMPELAENQTHILMVVSALVEAGASVNQRDELHGASPLHAASAGGHGAVVQLLVRAGAHLDARDNYGATALMQAVSKRKLTPVLMLAEAGSDILLQDNGGRSPVESLLSGPVLWKLMDRAIEAHKAAPPEAAAAVYPPCLPDLIYELLRRTGRRYLTLVDPTEDGPLSHELAEVLRRLLLQYEEPVRRALPASPENEPLLLAARAAAGLGAWVDAALACAQAAERMGAQPQPNATTRRRAQVLQLAALAAGAAGDVSNATRYRSAYWRVLRPPLSLWRPWKPKCADTKPQECQEWAGKGECQASEGRGAQTHAIGMLRGKGL